LENTLAAKKRNAGRKSDGVYRGQNEIEEER